MRRWLRSVRLTVNAIETVQLISARKKRSTLRNTAGVVDVSGGFETLDITPKVSHHNFFTTKPPTLPGST